MHSTPASLLERLHQPSETLAWGRFVDLYSPLLFRWAKQLGLSDHDRADLVQDVFLVLVRKLPEFQYDPVRSFHAWLKTVFLNQHRVRLRNRSPILNDDACDRLAAKSEHDLEDSEHHAYLIRQAFRLIASEFSAQQQKAFNDYVLGERAPEDVASELNISPGTVYSIKSKILSRLRQELRGLLD